MLDAAQPIAVARSLLEPLVRRGLPHLLVELLLNRLRVAGQELDHLVDDRAVVLLRDVADARRQAALDVVVETRDARVAPRLRAFTGTVREDAVEDIERLADLLRVRVRPEVDDSAPVALAREHDPRVLVLDRDRDVRKGLVVPQPDVEGRPVPLDEVLLEVERLDLVLGDDHLDVRHPLRQLPDRRARVGALLEVGAHARAQGLGLAHVEHIPGPIPEEVDPGQRGQGFQLIFEPSGHEFSLAPRNHPKHEAGG
jgi:hypothetical protein